ncbi:MAG: argininosuccinate lyase [Oscillospiraceae bacterium]|jgi:argininosuccinate lyase|nr:argininosuccinate lyase [Oscillospiraceae bacterium]
MKNTSNRTTPHRYTGAAGKLWAGRFQKDTDALVGDFNASLSFDARLYREDIEGSVAHAAMLGAQGIIPPEDAEAVIAELGRLLTDIEEGRVTLTPEAEDIHMNVEQLLTARLGDAGRRLHTARSRNDQVALDLRLYLKKQICALHGLTLALQDTLATLAEAHVGTVMPGYTHLQRAQPITLAHALTAYAEMLSRDVTRLEDCHRRMDVCPLGAGALAATTYPIDRARTARDLGFADVTPNSLDAVGDRDFCIELCAVLSILMMHLSRLAEEVILWCSWEFGFAELDDAYSTGSSIMPQKKNPDVAELVRGKTGRVYGDLIALLTVMKALPLAYNKDMQEDKEPVFDAVDTARQCLSVFAPMLATLTFRPEAMRRAAASGFLNATDCADYLVRRGLPFREAYGIVGRLVRLCLVRGKDLEGLTLEEFHSVSEHFDADVYDALALDACVAARNVPGGPAAAQVCAHIEALRAFHRAHRNFSSVPRAGSGKTL